MASSTSLSQEIAAVLRTEILRGQYRAGERLPSERDLAARFHSSRGAVREALSNLAQLGIIDVQPGGVRIVAVEQASLAVLGHLMRLDPLPDLVLVDQFLQTFTALSILTTRSALEKGSPEQLGEALALVERLAGETGDVEMLLQHWRALLELFKAIDGNLVVQLIGNDLKAQFVQHIISLEIKPELDPRANQAIVRDLTLALRRRDVELAVRAVQEYSDTLRHFVVNAISKRQRQVSNGFA